MSDGKIRVSWEEMNSPEVDLKIKQQEMLGRAQDHQRQQGPPPLPGKRQGGSLLRNAIVYMALFGLVGGILAWFLGEMAMVVFPDRREAAGEFLYHYEQIETQLARGEITEAEAQRLTAELGVEYGGNSYVTILTDESLDDAERDRRISEMAGKDMITGLIGTSMLFFSVGVTIAISLAIADHVTGRNWRGVIISGSVASVLGLIGGAVGGIAANILYGMLGGGGGGASVKQIIARMLGWAVLEVFLAIAPGVVLRSWKRFGIGLAGGFLGGLFGGLLFDPIAMATNSGVLSRFVAISAIGVVAGVGTGLIENVAKSGWLRVVGGLIAGKQFIIYKNPTYLGSSPQCEIYLFKDPQVGPRHAAIHTVAGGYELEDLQSGTGTLVNSRPVSRVRLRNNDQVQVGATILLFQEKERVGS